MSAMKWTRVAAGLYESGRYTIRQGPRPGRFWVLRFGGSVFGLKTPCRFPTVREAKQAAEIDRRKREETT